MAKNDVVIKSLMDAVQSQKKSLGTRERVSWLTNGIFKRNGQNFFNINTITDTYCLASALGFMLSEEDSFNKACDVLNLCEEFKWDGYTVAEWQEDFQTRLRVIEWDKKKKALTETEKKLSSLVSEEARTEMELENIKQSLGL